MPTAFISNKQILSSPNGESLKAHDASYIFNFIRYKFSYSLKSVYIYGIQATLVLWQDQLVVVQYTLAKAAVRLKTFLNSKKICLF